MRWDYYTTPVYDDGYMSNWNPATGQVIVAPGTLTAVSSFFPKAATVVLGNPVPKAKTTNFRPRVAAAYRLTGNLVLRGGYGEFTENEGYGIAGRLSTNNPYSLTETYTNSITAGVAALTFPKPFPASPSSSLLPGQNITALPTKTDEGVIRQFNTTLETVVHGLGLKLAYVGARGVDMNYALDVNKPAASTIPFTNARKPFPIWASAYEVRTDGQWHYDSAVASAQRTVGPVTFTSSFTWANNISNYADTTDPYNVTDKWTRDASDRRNYFTASAIAPVPLGKGQRFASTTGPAGEPADQRLEDCDHRHVGFRPILLAVVHRTRPGERQPGLRHPVAGLRGQPELRRGDPFPVVQPGGLRHPFGERRALRHLRHEHAGRVPDPHRARQPVEDLRVYRYGEGGIYGADFQRHEYAALHDSQ